MPWFCLQRVIAVFPDHTRLPLTVTTMLRLLASASAWFCKFDRASQLHVRLFYINSLMFAEYRDLINFSVQQSIF